MTITERSEAAYRLPTTAFPRRYDLVLAPDLERASFTGEVTIDVDVKVETAEIVMHAAELEIHGARLREGWQSSGNPTGAIRELEVVLTSDDERATFVSSSPVAPGSYTLTCAFVGSLNDKLCGFYRSRFTDDAGVERFIATTQFEQTDARRAFPCFDEPDKKASFSVTLDVPDGMFAVSNGPELSSEPLSGGGRRVRFAETMVMSTYLVAFVVGPLEATAPIDVDGIPLRVIHLPGKGQLTGPALDSGAHALRFYRDYFGIDYPGLKLDLVALPDFAAGAMENVGCVTFREAIVLADPNNVSRTEHQRLVEVVDHEIAHMWFGDLVTMRWWNGIWLNEAFATFMALCCLDDYRPDWECFVGFSRDKGAALAVDGLHATRPIEFPVLHPDDAAAMFDVLTYEKGAGVLWMLERYLGRERFRAGVRQYLEHHAFGNTDTTDLWDAIEAQAGSEPIRAVMDSWIFQGGYPLVTASRARGDHTVDLAQQPFSYLPAPIAEDIASAIGHDWLVPVIARPIGSDDESRVLLGSAPTALAVRSIPVVVNVEGAGFYRVRYDEVLLKGSLERFEELSPGERFNLVADTWAVGLAQLGELAEFLAVVEHLTDERDPNVWSVVIGALGLLCVVAKEEDRVLTKRFVRRVLSPQLARVGWDKSGGEDEQTPLLRALLIGALGTFGGDESVIAESRARFWVDHADGVAVDADLVNSVLAVVAAHATRDEYEAILDRYRHPQSPMDEARHLNCLANVTDPVIAAEIYELCRSEVRTQNAPYLLSGLLRNPEVGPLTWRFVSSHFAELTERFPENSIHRMLDGISGLAQLTGTGEPVVAKDVRRFCEEHISGARRRLVTQSLERLMVNVRFGQAVRDELATLLT